MNNRIFPESIAKDLIDVQPMTQTTGSIFALKYHFSSNRKSSKQMEDIQNRWDDRKKKRKRKLIKEILS